VTSEGQSGSGQTDELTEVVISHIPVSNDKEVTITQIVEPSLQDNEEDELEGSMPSSIFGDKSPKEKQDSLSITETKHLEKGNTGLPLINMDRREMAERRQGKEPLSHRPQ